jgi:mandelate racemase
VDWADPILEEPLQVKDGHARIAARPGIGMRWDERAVKRFAL